MSACTLKCYVCHNNDGLSNKVCLKMMHGLFVQMSTSTPEYIDALLDHLIKDHPEVDEIAFSDVSLWHFDYLRSRAIPLSTFNYVYVGAPPIAWYGPIAGDTPKDLQSWMYSVAGVGGMLTPSYRWMQILADEAIAREASREGWHFYIGQEVGIDALGDHVRLRQAWEAYLIEVCRRVQQSPTRRVLWSPYAWDLWSSADEARRLRINRAMKTLVNNVKLYSGVWGITEIDLQDGRGAQPAEPETDAVNWYKLIRNCGTQVRINMEWFKYQEGYGYIPQTIEEMNRRLHYYDTNSVPLGCCWEARYWYVKYYSNHFH